MTLTAGFVLLRTSSVASWPCTFIGKFALLVLIYSNTVVNLVLRVNIKIEGVLYPENAREKNDALSS